MSTTAGFPSGCCRQGGEVGVSTLSQKADPGNDVLRSGGRRCAHGLRRTARGRGTRESLQFDDASFRDDTSRRGGPSCVPAVSWRRL